LAKTLLPPRAKREITDTFSEVGLLSDGNIKAAAAKVDVDGRYPVAAIDAALAKCPSLKSLDRIMIKRTLMRYRLE
jgi:hypothetical protein